MTIQEIIHHFQNLDYNITVGEGNLKQLIDSSALYIFIHFFKNEDRF